MFGLRLGGMGLIPRRSGASGPVNSATDWYFAALGLAGTPWANVSRTGLGTRVDSAGLVGFGPHNLLARSESGTGWTSDGTTITNGYAPVPEASADSAFGFTNPAVGTTYPRGAADVAAGQQITCGAWIWRASGSTTATPAYFDGAWRTVGAPLSLTSTPQFFTWTYTPASATTFGSAFSLALLGAGEVRITAARVCAGASAQAYVRTTGAARYLPRITHDPALDINGVPYTVTEQYGPELIPGASGTFDSSAGWSLAVGGGGGSATIAGGVLTLDGGTSNFPNATYAAGLTVGRTYQMTVVVNSAPGGAGALGIRVGGVASNGPDITAPGTYTFMRVADGADVRFIRNSGYTGAAVINSVSVREYLGTVTNGTPRPLGLLVEGQGTQLLRQTTDLTAAVWNDAGTSVTRTYLQDIGPFKVYRVQSTTGTGNQIRQNIGGASSTTYAAEWRIKPGTSARTRLLVYNFGPFQAVADAEFDWVAGVPVIRAGAIGTWQPVVGPTAQGFFVFRATGTTSAAAPSVAYGIYPDSVAGTGYVDVMHTQIEVAAASSSPIPNPGTGTAVRVADGTWDLTGSAFTAAWNQAQGTLYFEWIAPSVGFTQDIIMAHLAGNISESLGLYTSGGAVLSMWVRSGGTNQANFSVANNIIAGARNKAAFSWGPSGFALVLNGGTVATGAGTVPSPSALRLAGPTLVSGGVLSGIVATSYTRPTQLTGAALQALTA